MVSGGRRGRTRTAGDNVEACFASGDGNPNNGGDFELSGTIGQPDAGVMTGGDFELSGGFWHGGAAEPPPCPGDLDGDGITGHSDLGILLADWGCSGGDCVGDLETLVAESRQLSAVPS